MLEQTKASVLTQILFAVLLRQYCKFPFAVCFISWPRMSLFTFSTCLPSHFLAYLITFFVAFWITELCVCMRLLMFACVVSYFFIAFLMIPSFLPIQQTCFLLSDLFDCALWCIHILLLCSNFILCHISLFACFLIIEISR